MMGGMYAAISGLDANQTMLNVTANDLANVNTVGYKASQRNLLHSLTQVLRGASGSTRNGGTNPVQVGLGVQVAATATKCPRAPSSPPTTRSTSRSRVNGFLRVGTGTPPAEAPFTAELPPNDRLHARGRPDDQHQGLPDHPGRPLRDRPQRGGHRHRRRRDHLRAGHRRQLHL